MHSVVIVTWRRPEHVRASLAAISSGERVPEDVIVVDASEDDATAEVARGRRGVRYVRFPGGAGHMTTARNEGLRHARGAVISFLDDDVRPAARWAVELQEAFRDPSVAAVAGRVVNGDLGEAQEGVNRIGTVRPDGTLTGNFAADPGRVVDVDHGIGANMSFRREWLARLGGFRDVFPGTAMREDTDVFMRIAALGGRSIFVPGAVVENDSGPHVVGKRFDLRYAVWAEHNHVMLLALNRGLGIHSSVWTYLAARVPGLWREEPQRRALSRLARGLGRLLAMGMGLIRGAALRRTRRGQLAKTDPAAGELRRLLETVRTR